MTRCVVSPRARADLRDIGRYIAKGNRPRAISFVEELQRACERLADHPLMGRARPELRRRLRSFSPWRLPDLLPAADRRRGIVRILHAAQDARRAF